MVKPKQKKNYDERIENIDEVMWADEGMMHPLTYIHRAIIKGQDALANEDFAVGALQFTIFIGNAEAVARAAKKLRDDYDEKIAAFMKSKEYKAQTNISLRNAMLANEKMKLILAEAFSNTPIETPLKLA